MENKGSPKTYEPHIVAVWISDKEVVVQEFPYKEDAIEKYQEIATRARGYQKVVLAKVVRKHGEG
jgi:hypothetical protein